MIGDAAVGKPVQDVVNAVAVHGEMLGWMDAWGRVEPFFEQPRDDGGVIIPMFASYVFATSNKVGTPEQFASNWDLDGERWAERWWFA